MDISDRYFTDGLSCHYLKDGTVEAKRSSSSNNSVEIDTLTVGTPGKFSGYSALKILGQSRQTEVNSKNLGQDSEAGLEALLGKKDLQRCLTKRTVPACIPSALTRCT